MKISTSILSSKNREKCIKILNKSNTDYIHLDVMDGLFVNNTAMPIIELNNYLFLITKPVDIHLMVVNPLEYINKIKGKTIKSITIHLELKTNRKKIIKTIKNLGYNVGIAINPNTNIKKIIPYINQIDEILIMSVKPGKGGQKFIPTSINKAKSIRKIAPKVTLKMDGGINNKNINQLNNLIDVAVIGSYITESKNPIETINQLKN